MHPTYESSHDSFVPSHATFAHLHNYTWLPGSDKCRTGKIVIRPTYDMLDCTHITCLCRVMHNFPPHPPKIWILMKHSIKHHSFEKSPLKSLRRWTSQHLGPLHWKKITARKSIRGTVLCPCTPSPQFLLASRRAKYLGVHVNARCGWWGCGRVQAFALSYHNPPSSQ